MLLIHISSVLDISLYRPSRTCLRGQRSIGQGLAQTSFAASVSVSSFFRAFMGRLVDAACIFRQVDGRVEVDFDIGFGRDQGS